MRILAEGIHGISAEQREAIGIGQVVPQLFEPHRSRLVAVGPKQSHHFTKGAHAASALRKPASVGPMTFAKRCGSGKASPMNFESVSAASRITNRPSAIAAETSMPLDCNRSRIPSRCARVAMMMPLSPAQPGSNEPAYRVHEKLVVFVKLHEMLCSPHVRPVGLGSRLRGFFFLQAAQQRAFQVRVAIDAMAIFRVSDRPELALFLPVLKSWGRNTKKFGSRLDGKILDLRGPRCHSALR